MMVFFAALNASLLGALPSSVCANQANHSLKPFDSTAQCSKCPCPSISLEARLGARLVERNTRRLYLTDTGQAFFSRAKGILADLKDAESAVNATSLNPTGVLRISASLSFSLHHVAPLLREYTQRYPNVTVHIEAANRYPSRKHLSAKVRTFIDFVAEHFVKMDYERKWTGRFGVY